MWLQHVFSFLGTIVRLFFEGIGTTILGRIVDLAFASAMAVAILHQKKKTHGWLAMLSHWRQQYKVPMRFTLWCALVIYGPVAIWAIAKAVYEDHEYFVGTAKKLQASLRQNAGIFSGVQKGLDGQIADWRVKCSNLEGANGVLGSQNRDQQNTINNCQTQAIKLLQPEPFQWHAMALEEPERSSTNLKQRWLLLANKDKSPAEFTFNCSRPIVDAEAKIVGSVADARTVRIDQDHWQAQIRSPAWGPHSPVLVIMTLSVTNDPITSCNFKFEAITK